MPGGGSGLVHPDSPFPPPKRTLFTPTPAYAFPDEELMQADQSLVTPSKMGKHPCWRAREVRHPLRRRCTALTHAQESAKCLEQTNCDREACVDFFYNARACHKLVHERRGNWINFGGGGRDDDAPIFNWRILLENLGLREREPPPKYSATTR